MPLSNPHRGEDKGMLNVTPEQAQHALDLYQQRPLMGSEASPEHQVWAERRRALLSSVPANTGRQIEQLLLPRAAQNVNPGFYQMVSLSVVAVIGLILSTISVLAGWHVLLTALFAALTVSAGFMAFQMPAKEQQLLNALQQHAQSTGHSGENHEPV